MKRWTRGTDAVPDRHRQIVGAIYENQKCPVRFGGGDAPWGHGTLTVKVDVGAANASVRAEQLGVDTVQSICHAKRELVERSHVEAVYVELPVESPATPHVAEQLEREGFGFIGIAPHFSPQGDLLRLVYLVEPLAREPIKTYEEFADHLVDYVLAEQTRVRAAL